ncbi:benzoate/H(+) symporter BenE family transporter, partial [Klebsiella pneumoniae]|uniref:benzoate/H(+) symporter BenE family transporter n=1 Tax=Klebsiella pneumoniae TaxID=573 RepID=UPI00214AE531
MGISTLALSAWRKVPVLTAWSTPGAALLVSGLQGVTLADAVYIGGPGFGARHNASNSLSDIAGLVPFAHRFGAKVFVTL